MTDLETTKAKTFQAIVAQNETLLTLLVFFGSYPILYLVNILLARTLGAANYGDFAVTRSVATLAATTAVLGLQRASLHFLPVYRKQGAHETAKGFIYAALLAVIVTGLVISGLGVVITQVARSRMLADEHPVMIAMFWVMPMSLGLLTLSLLGGHQQVFLSSLLGKVGLPLITGLLLGVVFLFGDTLTDFRAVWLVILARLLLTVWVVWLLWTIWRREYRQVAPQFELKLWAVAALPFLLSTLVHSALWESSMLILEAHHPSEAEVGIYAAVQQVAYLPILALGAITTVAMPRLSVLLEEKETAPFQRQLGIYLRILIAFGAGSLIVYIVGGNFLLGLFGHDFRNGQTPLVVLGAGYLIALVGGLVIPLLEIRQERKIVNLTMLALLAFNIALTYLLAPHYGALGAATAYTVAVAVVYTVQLILLQRRTGIPYLRSIVGSNTVSR